MAERRQHPTVSDVALALATRHSEPTCDVEIHDTAKGDFVPCAVKVTDPNVKTAAKAALDTYKVIRADLDAFTAKRNGA